MGLCTGVPLLPLKTGTTPRPSGTAGTNEGWGLISGALIAECSKHGPWWPNPTLGRRVNKFYRNSSIVFASTPAVADFTLPPESRVDEAANTGLAEQKTLTVSCSTGKMAKSCRSQMSTSKLQLQPCARSLPIHPWAEQGRHKPSGFTYGLNRAKLICDVGIRDRNCHQRGCEMSFLGPVTPLCSLQFFKSCVYDLHTFSYVCQLGIPVSSITNIYFNNIKTRFTKQCHAVIVLLQ